MKSGRAHGAGVPGPGGKEQAMSTADDLRNAFAGESQANRTYLAFAKKADEEGYPQVARLFRASADAETVHAHAHLAVMGGIKGTADNLREAIGGETHEFTEMYPAMIDRAKEEGNKAASESFRNANAVERIHASLYQKALDSLGSNEEVVYHVCQYCGNTVEGEAPEKCPICGRPRTMFKRID